MRRHRRSRGQAGEDTGGAFPHRILLFARVALAGITGCAITLFRCVRTYKCVSATDVQPTNPITLYMFFIYFLLCINTIIYKEES